MTEPNLKTQESYFIVMDFRNKIKKLRITGQNGP